MTENATSRTIFRLAGKHHRLKDVDVFNVTLNFCSRFDGYDCCPVETVDVLTASQLCPLSMDCDRELVQDGVCDASMNVSQCYFDMGRFHS